LFSPPSLLFLLSSLPSLLMTQIKYEANQTKGYYGLEIIHQDDYCSPASGAGGERDHYKHETRTLYCKTEAERDSWLTTLQHAAQVVPIEEDYLIGGELGTGRFSVVCDCQHKVTGVQYAVKIIEKASIEAEDKALLRTEIAGKRLLSVSVILSLHLSDPSLALFLSLDAPASPLTPL
jgi:serine/threonine protein kinase